MVDLGNNRKRVQIPLDGSLRVGRTAQTLIDAHKDKHIRRERKRNATQTGQNKCTLAVASACLHIDLYIACKSANLLCGSSPKN